MVYSFRQFGPIFLPARHSPGCPTNHVRLLHPGFRTGARPPRGSSNSSDIVAPRPVSLSRSTNKTIFHSPYTLPSSVSYKSFTCHSYKNCRGVYQQIPILVHAESGKLSTRRSHSPSFASLFKFFLFKLLRTLLHPPKTQLFYFQPIPHSLPKNTGGGGDGCRRDLASTRTNSWKEAMGWAARSR